MQKLVMAAAVGLAVFAAAHAHAACSNPAGNEGDMVYAGNAHVMVFCNGSSWMSMSGGSAEAPTGTWCGLRQLQGMCLNATTANYVGTNIACNGTTLTATCVYNSDYGTYVPQGTVNCPSGYTGVYMTSWIPAAGAQGSSIACVRN